MPNLIASCYAESYRYHREACSFLQGNGGAVDLVGGEADLGGVKGEEAAVGMYYMREEFF